MVDNHFSLLDIKLCFSSLPVRNAKLVSFFFVRFYLSTKTKNTMRERNIVFSLHLYRFFGCFCTRFFDFLVGFNDFFNKKVQTICLNSFIYRIFWTFQNFFKKFLIFYKIAYIFKGYFTPRTLIA